MTNQRVFSYRHVVSFEDTNVVGNVYFARHVAWQGACREMFLRTHAPGILAEIERDLRLITLNVHCEYFAELRAFDEVELRMSLLKTNAHKISLGFDYRHLTAAGAQQCAKGSQDIGCMRERPDKLEPCPIPEDLECALAKYRPTFA